MVAHDILQNHNLGIYGNIIKVKLRYSSLGQVR
jgi:hypothetical protein